MKRQVDEIIIQLEFEADDNGKEYKVKAIRDSAIYAMESECHLLGLYYLVLQKGYLKKENTQEPTSAVQHLQKLINIFYKDYPKKSTASLPSINTALPMAKPTIIPEIQATKQKHSRIGKANNAKHAKKS